MLTENVEKVIKKIKPFIQPDGRDIQLVSVSEDGIVKVKLTGACRGCPISPIEDELQ